MPLMAERGTATISLSTLEAEFPGVIAGIEEPRVLLKSDTQGHDAEVLRGAGEQGLDEAVVAVLVVIRLSLLGHVTVISARLRSLSQ